ncbi:hypothetical protein AARAC_002493 [Aspergillus arachidicola]|uniref:Luciferase domain-containing protein n=1 Tax=Aspergillus arachidicola TaxID=656916 RepID=A0A2G7FSB3_9EURO|nr:hypothetical protein AARAC_002493 [Aspergillus arachidicola]
MAHGFSPLAIPTPAETTAKFTLPLDILLPLLLFPTIFLAHHIRKDYHAYLALGPGGAPQTQQGTSKSASCGPSPSETPSHLPPSHALSSPKKAISKAATSQTASGHVHKYLVNAHPSVLYTGTSCFEKHSTGIFCRLGPGALSRQEQEQQRKRLTCNGEVCHAHPIDGSLHLTLHPADIRLVLEKGWGQRHPIAREDWWWWRRSVPSGFVMIYAPRNEEERRCVVEIIRAAAWWVRGEALPECSPE